MNYPAPEMWLDNEVLGAKLIAIVALEDYDRGYHPMVQDEYEPVGFYSVTAPGNVKYRWQFARRVRVFTKPTHNDAFTGEPYHCEMCEAFWAEAPDKPDEVLLEAGNVPPPGSGDSGER